MYLSLIDMESDIYGLRARGHELIGQIIDTGMKQKEVYALLSRRMEVPQFHFSKTNDHETAVRANLNLLSILEHRREKLKKQEKNKRYRTELFTDKAVLQEVARRNEKRLATPRWKLALARLRNILAL